MTGLPESEYVMCVYLIHFEQPYKHARHYLGYSDNLAARIAAHEHGNGARLMSVISRNDIRWVVARVWPNGGPDLERKLKRHHGSCDLCPICAGRVHPGYVVDIKQMLFERAAPALGSHQGKRRPM